MAVGQLRIWIKQQIQYNIQGQPIIWQGTNPYNLRPVINGTLSSARQWQDYGNYIDVTEYVSDLTKFSLTWTAERDTYGTVIPGELQTKKSSSGSIQFESTAYLLLKSWLVDDVSAPLNGVSVKVEHVGCGVYDNYAIKAQDIRWCEEGDNLCVFEVTIKQEDSALDCISRTWIADNHQGWFQWVPANGKKHPRFSYCNEVRPNGLLILTWWNGAIVWTITGLILFSLYGIINSVIFAINGVINTINAIINFINSLGASINTINTIDYLDPKDILQNYEAKFLESGGCGREHPAPLIRDYIQNVCDKCRVSVNASSAPIFFAPSMPVETSSRGVVTAQNPHYNACYFSATVKRGIRRMRNIGIFGSNPNNSDFYIPDNAPIHHLDTFLDELKGVYNAEWRIVNNILYFQRKDFFIQGNYILDFTPTAADRLKLLEGICFEWNEVKYPASCTGLYGLDAGDSCGNEALSQMNGSVSFGMTDTNPNFDGILDKTTTFGGTKFRLDGAATDYIYDAMQVVVNGSLLTVGFLVPLFKFVIAPAFEEYADYGLLLQEETSTLPKILLWDGVSYTNAKCIKTRAAGFNVGAPQPVPNTKYNTGKQITTQFTGIQMVATAWHYLHEPQTFVIGSSLNFGSTNPGTYRVQDYFGITVIESPAMLVNYFMYFEPWFEDTLWDWFHWIDDPAANPKAHMKWTAKIALCCEDLKDLGLFGDPALNGKVKIPYGYLQDGRITEITANYDVADPLGQHIEIKGEL